VSLGASHGERQEFPDEAVIVAASLAAEPLDVRLARLDSILAAIEQQLEAHEQDLLAHTVKLPATHGRTATIDPRDT
jgi:transcriptional regulator NrdR family protein